MSCLIKNCEQNFLDGEITKISLSQESFRQSNGNSEGLTKNSEIPKGRGILHDFGIPKT